MGSLLCVPLFTVENMFPLLFSWRRKKEWERGDKRSEWEEKKSVRGEKRERGEKEWERREKKSEREEKKKVCIEINTEVSFQTK